MGQSGYVHTIVLGITVAYNNERVHDLQWSLQQ